MEWVLFVVDICESIYNICSAFTVAVQTKRKTKFSALSKEEKVMKKKVSIVITILTAIKPIVNFQKPNEIIFPKGESFVILIPMRGKLNYWSGI